MRRPGRKIGLIYTAAVLLCSGCEKSILGPQISDYNVDEETGSVTSGSVPQPGNIDGGTDSPGSTSSNQETCTRTAGHNVWYIKSLLNLAYSCSPGGGTYTTSNRPAFLTETAATNIVSFTGTAPDLSSSSAWNINESGSIVTGDGSSITTTIIDTQHTSDISPASNNLSTKNGMPINATAAATTLDTRWDGSITDVAMWVVPGSQTDALNKSTVDLQQITLPHTDLHGMVYLASCIGASGSYLCGGTASAPNTRSMKNDFVWQFQYSAFDQGKYYLDVTPVLQIEGGIHHLTKTTLTIDIPIQTAGNVEVNTSVNGAADTDVDDGVFYYSISLNPLNGSRIYPRLGFAYPTISGTVSANFVEIDLDRKDDPADGTSNGVNINSNYVISGGVNTESFLVKAGADGKQTVIGIVPDGGGKKELVFKKLSVTGGTTALDDQAVLRTGTSQSIAYAAISGLFSDTGSDQRLGVAFVRDATNIVIGKINPDAAGGAALTNYSLHSGVETGDTEFTSASNIANLSVAHHTVSGTGYFYLAYRRGTHLYASRVLSNGASSAAILASRSTSLIKTAVFVDDPNKKQALTLALGDIDDQSVAGISYSENDANNSNKPYCYFVAVNSALSAGSVNQIPLTSQQCLFPQTFFNPKTKKFFVVYSSNKGDGNYGIYYHEITVTGGIPVASQAEMVADISSEFTAKKPLKLTADYLPDWDFTALVYRVHGGDNTDPRIRIHGFHTLSR